MATSAFARGMLARAACPASRPRLCTLAVQATLLGLASSPGWAQTADPSTTTLPSVTVEGTREQPTAGHTATLSAEQLQHQGAASMADVVRYQPLVSAPGIASGSGNLWDGSGTQGFNIRGVDGNRVAIDVDGIALPGAENKPDNAQNNSFSTGRDTIDPELYRQVEIESGASPSGRPGSQGLGGRVSFVTHSPEDFLTGGRTTFAGYKLGYLSRDRSWAQALTGAAQIGGVQALGIYSRRDGKAEKNDGAVAANPDDWHSNALLAKFVWGAATDQRLGLSVEHYDRQGRVTANNKITSAIPQAPEQRSENRRTRVSLEHQYAPAAGTPLFDTLANRLYYQSAEARNNTWIARAAATSSAPYSRQIRTNSETDTWGWTSDATQRLGSHRLFYGLALDRSASERPWEETRTSLATGADIPQSLRDRAAQARVTTLSVYARDEISGSLWGHRATLTPGLTVRHQRITPTNEARYASGSATSASEFQRSSDTVLTPSLNLSVAVTPGLDAYAQYSRGARWPTISELTGSFENPTTGYAILGNPALKKETSDNIEFGIKGQPTAGVTLHASTFYSRYKNYIEYASLGYDPSLPQYAACVVRAGSPCIYRPVNLGRATLWGAELATRFELGTWSPSARGYSLNLAAGWQQGQARNAETGTRGWLPSSLPAKVVAGIAYDAPSQRFGLALNATYARGKQARGDVISGTATTYYAVPSATVFDATAYWNISRNVSLQVGIYNLTNRKYWDYASVYALGTTALADIERQSEPGRNAGATLRVQF